MKRITDFLFYLAFILIALLQLGVFPNSYTFIITIASFVLAGISIVFKMLFPSMSKHSASYTVVYWAGVLITLTGTLFRILHLPASLLLIYAGIGILVLSFFMPKSKSDKDLGNDEVLDNF